MPSRPAPDFASTQESLVPAKLRVRAGQVVGIVDHLGNDIGLPLTVKSGGDGGNRFFASLVAQLDGIISGAIVRDSNGAATSAPVTFPDGVTGTYTALVVSTAFPGAVDSYSVTYGSVGTYTQPAVTRDSSGAVTQRPPITYVGA